MNKIVNKFWGVLPFIMIVFCGILVTAIEKVTDNTFRILPHNILICLGIICFGVLLLWLNTRKKIKMSDHRIFSLILKITSVFLFVVITLICLFVMGFSHRPEHIVTKNGVKMVASVNSYEYVNYYEYKNIFFYGQNLGYEYYGSGGNDPLAQKPKPDPIRWTFYDLNGNVIDSGSKGDYEEYNYDDTTGTTESQQENILKQKADIKELDFEVIENRSGELVFSVSIDDFIDSYNGYYWNDKNIRYLLPSTEWRSQIYDTAIHSNYETKYYNFTEDEKIWSLPTISVYVPTNNDYIQEITLNFDDHSYTKQMYTLYEEMCFYTLRVLFPDCSSDKITELYMSLNKLAYDNVFPNEKGYNSNSTPCALYYKNGIGLYPYFAIGECFHLCIIPVTQETISDFEARGVRIYEIE